MPFSLTIIFGARQSDYADVVGRYQKLITPFAKLSIEYCRFPLMTDSDTAAVRRREEQIILRQVPAGGCLIALSEEGKKFSSQSFARWISRHQQESRPLYLCIGGAYGFSEDFKKRCSDVISLAELTMPHKLALLVLVEQVYRAFTILKGHPYHK